MERGWKLVGFVRLPYQPAGAQHLATDLRARRGALTVVLVCWLWIAGARPWLRWLGIAALGAVITQGLLGGLTVLFFLPPAISTAHAALAELFFCALVSIALFTSPRWDVQRTPI